MLLWKKLLKYFNEIVVTLKAHCNIFLVKCNIRNTCSSFFRVLIFSRVLKRSGLEKNKMFTKKQQRGYSCPWTALFCLEPYVTTKKVCWKSP